jgi:glycerate 2-kinase
MKSSKFDFLIAPDKFKGSLTAHEAAKAMKEGVEEVFPSARVHTIPLADGGDGTAMILREALRARSFRCIVHDPLGRKIGVCYGLHKKTAYLDLASASGLDLISVQQRNPMKTSSRGVGELIAAAVKRGARKIVLGVGGSATVEGGVGAMKALGVRFLDHKDKEIPEGAQGLEALEKINVESCILKDLGIEIVLLADVKNPLIGKQGAASVFGPQKGASSTMVPKLELGLKTLNQVILKSSGKSVATTPSGGAAGGIIAGFKGILGNMVGVHINITQGIDYVLQALNVKKFIQDSDRILTGEGKLDTQTLQGKTVAGVVHLAKSARKQVIAVAGQVSLNSAQIKKFGLSSAINIVPDQCTYQQSLHDPALWLRKTVVRALRVDD